MRRGMGSTAFKRGLGASTFKDRAEAGERLGEALKEFANRKDVIVLGIPRGGVAVAAEVAKRLGAPLDVFLVRKLGFPGQSELAMGAIASGGLRVLNRDLLRNLGVDDEAVAAATRLQMRELEARGKIYRRDRPALKVEGRTVILVDDGLATGASLRAAIRALRQARPARIVAAVPVAAREGLEAAHREADRTVCLATPESFRAVGEWYEDFHQVSDEEVEACLRGDVPPEAMTE